VIEDGSAPPPHTGQHGTIPTRPTTTYHPTVEPARVPPGRRPPPWVWGPPPPSGAARGPPPFPAAAAPPPPTAAPPPSAPPATAPPRRAQDPLLAWTLGSGDSGGGLKYYHRSPFIVRCSTILFYPPWISKLFSTFSYHIQLSGTNIKERAK